MRISFLGAAQTVTGSQHLISMNGTKVLLDCGLYQGRGPEARRRNENFDFDPAELSAVILSHAHIDHSGNLPNLVKQGFAGPIYGTHGTAHLADVMLRDSAHIQELEAAEENEIRQKRRQAVVLPLYTSADAGRVKEQFRPQSYNKLFEVAPGMTARLVEAGHMLGSAAVSLEVEEKGKLHRIWFSGDIGRRNLPLIRDPELPRDADVLIMECTDGNKSHDDPLQALEELRTVMKRTVERGGKVIIPAFVVGRTQEIVYDLHQMIESGELPKIPVFVDSPLALETSKVFMNHPRYFDDETHEFMEETESDNPLWFDLLTYVDSVEQSKALKDQDEPMVIISSSGMAETGRVVHHIRNNIGDPRNTILLVSYQAPNTLGRDLADGAEQVEIWGDVFPVKAEVVQISGLSGHAGQRFLQEYAEAVKGQAQQVFLVHGEQKPAEALRENLQSAGLEKIYFPYPRQSMEIGG